MKRLFVRCTKGFGSIEMLATLGVFAIVIGLTVPTFHSSVEKRRLSQGAELIVGFVNTVQSESIKRNRKVTVSYATGDSGQWCIGASFGKSACDCMQRDPAELDWCGQGGAPWVLRQDDVDADNLVQSVSGDGALVFDPVRGLFMDRGDMLTLALGAGEGEFQASVGVVSTGKVAVCVFEASSGSHESQSCPQGL